MKLAVFATFIMPLLGCEPAKPACSLAQRLETLRRVDRATFSIPDQAKAAVITAAYTTLFRADASVERLGTDIDAWALRYRAAQLAGYYTQEPYALADMATALAALEQRNGSTDEQYRQMYEAFVASRKLSEARALARLHPRAARERLPTTRDDTAPGHKQPTAWVLDPEEPALVRRNVQIDQPARVLIITHPLCHFSRTAMQDLESDTELASAMRGHTTYLAPQDGRLHLATVESWNRKHPSQAVQWAYKHDEWPIDGWSTPTFYFLEHGIVRAKVEGWPRGGRRTEVLNGLRQIGLSP